MVSPFLKSRWDLRLKDAAEKKRLLFLGEEMAGGSDGASEGMDGEPA